MTIGCTKQPRRTDPDGICMIFIHAVDNLVFALDQCFGAGNVALQVGPAKIMDSAETADTMAMLDGQPEIREISEIGVCGCFGVTSEKAHAYAISFIFDRPSRDADAGSRQRVRDIIRTVKQKRDTVVAAQIMCMFGKLGNQEDGSSGRIGCHGDK